MRQNFALLSVWLAVHLFVRLLVEYGLETQQRTAISAARKIHHSCQEAHIVTALGLAIFSFHLDINQYVAGTIVEHVLASVKNVSFRQC